MHIRTVAVAGFSGAALVSAVRSLSLPLPPRQPPMRRNARYAQETMLDEARNKTFRYTRQSRAEAFWGDALQLS